MNESQFKTHAFKVHVTRGPLVESRHQVHVASWDLDQKQMSYFGEAKDLVYPRSCIKMLQAFLLVESGAIDKFGLTHREIALACSSHWGDPLHVEAAEQWAKKIQIKESDLVCGEQDPTDPEAARYMILHQKKPGRLHNNCSGKHLGFLSYLRASDLDIQGYENFDHPLQKRLRSLLSELSGENVETAPYGIDGCGIPTYAMSLAGMARAMGVFLDPPAQYQKATRIIIESLRLEPHYISSLKDFSGSIILKTKGQALAKGGAEGVYTAIDFRRRISYSLKVVDGSHRATMVTLCHVMKQMGSLTEEEFQDLRSYSQPELKNWSGAKVGEVYVFSENHS